MSNSNGYNPNSLFALEYSLLGNNPAYQSEQFSDEEIEDLDEDRIRGVEAQAFDWDDAIALQYEEERSQGVKAQAFDSDDAITLKYEEDTDPDSESISQQDAEELEEEDSARSMSWQNYGYSSRGFDLEDEDTPSYEAQAFAVEEEGTTEGEDDPLSHSNSLFALEQSVFGTTSTNQPAQQFSIEEPQHQPIESQAFDWDDAIALEYSETLYPTSMSLDWEPSDYSSQSFSLEDEPSTYNVEAFEEEEESEDAPANEDFSPSTAYGFDAGDEVSAPPEEAPDKSRTYAVDADYTPELTSQEDRDSATIPVNATVVMPPIPPRKSVQPAEVLSDNDFDEFDRGTPTNRAADAEAFAADLAAILQGEKVYEPPAETPAPPAPQPQTQPVPQSQAQSAPPKKSGPHDIFDQMGKNMAHATAFDLGTFSLEQKFDEFDRILDEQESESLAYTEDNSESEDENTSTKAQAFDTADVTLNLQTGTVRERQVSWDAIIGRRSKSDGNISPNFKVKIIYLDGESQVWEVRPLDLYVGYKDNGKDIFPSYNNSFNIISLYAPKNNISKEDQALSAAVIISEAARFAPIRARIEALILGDTKPMKYSEIQPIVTNWNKLVDWKKLKGIQNSDRQVITASDIRSFATDSNPYGAEKDQVLQFITESVEGI